MHMYIYTHTYEDLPNDVYVRVVRALHRFPVSLFAEGVGCGAGAWAITIKHLKKTDRSAEFFRAGGTPKTVDMAGIV